MDEETKSAEEAVTVAPPAPPVEVSAVEVAAALRRYSWVDDSDKTKMASAICGAFIITARPEPAE